MENYTTKQQSFDFKNTAKTTRACRGWSECSPNIRLSLYGFMDEFSVFRKISKLTETEKTLMKSLEIRKFESGRTLHVKFIDPKAWEISHLQIIKKLRFLLSVVSEVRIKVTISDAFFDGASCSQPVDLKCYEDYEKLYEQQAEECTRELEKLPEFFGKLIGALPEKF